LSSYPISEIGMFLFLKKKEEVLEVTFSSLILARALMISTSGQKHGTGSWIIFLKFRMR